MPEFMQGYFNQTVVEQNFVGCFYPEGRYDTLLSRPVCQPHNAPVVNAVAGSGNIFVSDADYFIISIVLFKILE